MACNWLRSDMSRMLHQRDLGHRPSHASINSTLDFVALEAHSCSARITTMETLVVAYVGFCHRNDAFPSRFEVGGNDEH